MTPRPAPILLLTFGAGLATGLARFQEPLGVGAVLLLAAWFGRRGGLGFGSAAALLGLVLGAVVRQAEDGSCAARFPAGTVRVEARLLEPVLPDARLARAAVRGRGCEGEVLTRWPRGATVEAGTLAALEGKWLPRPGPVGRSDGLLMVAESQVTGNDPGVATRLRQWLAVTTRRLYGTRAGTVDALVMNRRGAMDPDLRDRYGRAGLVHILSISGFHVGVIVGWIVLLARAVHLTRPRATMAASLVAVAYVLLLAWPAPAARAALLALVAAQAQLRQRHPQAMSLLAVTCLLVLLLDPWAIVDAGAWLSAGALTGALVATRWSDRALGATWFWRTLSGSLGATLATAPITAMLFGTVSLVGIGLNFIAIPLAAVAVPGVLLSLLFAPLIPPFAAALAAGSGALLGLLDRVAWWGGSWEGAAITVPAEPRSALPWVVILGVALWGVAGRATRWVALQRWALAAAVASWFLLLAGEFHGADADSGLTLHFLDVGQGDAAAIHTPAGHWILIDGGPVGDGWDAGRRVVVPFLERQRAPGVALVLLSHAHADHLGGLGAVVERYPPGEVLEPAELVADPLYAGWLGELEARDVPWRAGRTGLRFEIDSVRFTVLHPDSTWPGWQEDLNEDSMMLLLEYRGFRALFAGDAGLPAEAWLRGRVGRVDLLKVGHHGSRSASGAPWLAELAPKVAVMSLGTGNRYGHPHREVLERLHAAGVSLWRTDQDGSVRVVVDSAGFVVEGKGRVERWRRSEGDAVIPGAGGTEGESVIPRAGGTEGESVIPSAARNP
ncbi:MAG: DNA internalization-related competence protein ComEC/Rec2 [Gemmatimonadales bacterium]